MFSLVVNTSLLLPNRDDQFILVYCFNTLREGSPENHNLRNSLDWFMWEEVSIQREWISLKEGGKLCERVAGLSECGYPVNGWYVSVNGLSLLRVLSKGIGICEWTYEIWLS